jgi:hypothetical protein
MPRHSPVDRLNKETVRNLFLRFKGFVDITAAEVGTGEMNGNFLQDFGGARGAFTTAFLKLACAAQVYGTWADFFPALRDLTRTSSNGNNQAQAFALREDLAGPAAPVTMPAGGAVTPGAQVNSPRCLECPAGRE